MVTTIQLRENVKRELDRRKESRSDTYEDVILGLMRSAEQQKRQQKSLLTEGYLEMAKESARVTKEWSSADRDWD
ncbi:MAG: hypothetical protein ABIF10_04975 [Candidatus Woesearchaeota archaeon]